MIKRLVLALIIGMLPLFVGAGNTHKPAAKTAKGNATKNYVVRPVSSGHKKGKFADVFAQWFRKSKSPSKQNPVHTSHAPVAVMDSLPRVEPTEIVEPIVQVELASQQNDSLLYDARLLQILLQYYLYSSYDSANIAYVLDLADKFALQEKQPEVWSVLYPRLKNYGIYTKEIDSCIGRLIRLIEWQETPRTSNFDFSLSNTTYRKECEYLPIPYLEEIIDRVYVLLDSPRKVTIESLTSIRKDLE